MTVQPRPHRRSPAVNYGDDDDTIPLFTASTTTRVQAIIYRSGTTSSSTNLLHSHIATGDRLLNRQTRNSLSTSNTAITKKVVVPSPTHRRESRSHGDTAAKFGRSSTRRIGEASPSMSPRGKPRWYECAFGTVRFPVEMNLEGIRRRQGRWRASPEVTGGGGWRWLKSLSCRSDMGVVEWVAEEGFVVRP